MPSVFGHERINHREGDNALEPLQRSNHISAIVPSDHGIFLYKS
jgi:hypothetical protein